MCFPERRNVTGLAGSHSRSGVGSGAPPPGLVLPSRGFQRGGSRSLKPAAHLVSWKWERESAACGRGVETSSWRSLRPSCSPELSRDTWLGVDARLLGQGASRRSLLAQPRAGRGAQGAVRARGADGAGRPGAPALFNAHSPALPVLLLLLQLLLLVTVPMELYSFAWFHYHWVYDDLGCRASYSAHELCACATMFSVASLSVEHCLALCQPPARSPPADTAQDRCLLSLCWTISFGLALPKAVLMGQKHELEIAGRELLAALPAGGPPWAPAFHPRKREGDRRPTFSLLILGTTQKVGVSLPHFTGVGERLNQGEALREIWI